MTAPRRRGPLNRASRAIGWIARAGNLVGLMKKEMTAETLVELYRGWEEERVVVWLDGGWAVDALLGEQTRPHDDVDIVVAEDDVDRIVAFLRGRGYRDVPRDDTRPWNFVLGNDDGSEVDFHVINLDDRGNGVYGPAENGDIYPADALDGTGTIAGYRVRCMSLAFQIENRTRSEPGDKDRHDIHALCKRFGVALPGQNRDR